LGAFSDFIANAGTKSANTLGGLLADALLLNAAMSDGTALFHTNHGNLAGSGTAITTASLGAARAAMRAQVGPDGQLIAVTPRFLIVGPAKETEAETVLATIAAGTGADANLFAGKLQLLVEPRITGNQWFVAGDPGINHAVEYAELDGTRSMSGTGPSVDTREGFDMLGLEVRVVYDVGAGVVAFQPLYRNAGA
jgi:hypothetical protein